MTASQTRTAIVTGATAGIGQATALALSKAGYQVFGTSRTAGAATGPFTLVACDITSEVSVAALVAEVVARTGRIDLLVNNAGYGMAGGAEEFSIAQGQALFDVNLFGAVRLMRAVLPVMRAQGQGRVVNISSVMGLIPAPFMALYAASKHALEGYSESLDHEVRGFGVRVLLVEPAYTRTTFEANMVAPETLLPVYDGARASVAALTKEVMATADLPEVVAQTVLRAAQDLAPKPRYPAGKVAAKVSLLRRLVPAKAFDKSFRKQMRLPA